MVVMHAGSGEQMPGEVASLQVSQVPLQALSQQTPSAPQTPAAHSAVEPQAVPGVFWGWQWAVPSQ
jgi:hypothetical protein